MLYNAEIVLKKLFFNDQFNASLLNIMLIYLFFYLNDRKLLIRYVHILVTIF